MMSDFILSCETAADLSKEQYQNKDIKYICFNYEMDGVAYPDDLGVSMTLDEFYRRVMDGADTKTSQCNAEQYVEHFKPYVEEGKEILHLTLSSGISGTYNSAMIAKDMLEEEFPGCKIYIVDSLAASTGYGMIMDELSDMRAAGKSIDECYEWVEANKKRLHHWFFSADLTTFIRGGRISKTAGTFGTALQICPLMNVDFMGRLIVRDKVRTKKKVITAIVDRMAEHADEDYTGKVFLSNSSCIEDAQAVADKVNEKFPNNAGVVINDIGPTIGSHTGIGTVALFFWGDERID